MRTHFTRKFYFRVAHIRAGCSDRSSCPRIKQKCPIGAFLFYLGWGSWIRTNTSGVRVRCSTIKLCPNNAEHYNLFCGICKYFFYLHLHIKILCFYLHLMILYLYTNKGQKHGNYFYTFGFGCIDVCNRIYLRGYMYSLFNLWCHGWHIGIIANFIHIAVCGTGILLLAQCGAGTWGKCD